jgi:hypothetical protein
VEKPTTKLTAQDSVILYCVATGIDPGAVGILAHAMQSMAIRGFIAHNRESGVYTLTDSGCAAAISDGCPRANDFSVLLERKNQIIVAATALT